MIRASSFADRLLARPFATSVPVVLATLLALPVVAGLGVDNALEIWLDRSGAAYREYQEFRRIFGSEEFILVIYPLPEPVELAFLERLTDLRFELEEIDGVAEVYDLARLYARLFSLRGLAAFRREIASSPLVAGFLVSGDRRLAATWIHLGGARPEERRRIVEAVEAALGRAPPGEGLAPGDVRLAGSPYLSVALDRSSRGAARTFFPLVFVLSGIVLALLFRRLSGVVIPFVSVGAGIVWTLALIELAGSSLNMVTVTLPPLVWVLGLSTSIHLLSRWQWTVARGGTARQAARRALAELFRPCLFSALTTALGFASLATSSLGPVREMGTFAALGVLLCFASNFLLFPALIELATRISKRPPALREDHPLLAVLGRLSRRPRLVLAATAAFALVFAAGVPRLAADSNPIDFFRHDAPIAVTYKQVLPGFTGAYSLELTLEPPAIDLAAVAEVDKLRSFLESRDEVARALSVVDLVKRAHQQIAGGDYRLPATAAGFAAAWSELERRPAELSTFVAAGVLRVSVLARPTSSIAHQRLVEEVAGYLERRIDRSWKPRLTGIVPLLVDMQERLVDSQIRTFAVAFVVIMTVLALLLRRASYALASLAPNLLPIVFALGTMGWLGIALDPATVMIAGIALGIAVDDTIHFLEHYGGERRAGRGPGEAVEKTLDAVGRPMVITSLVAALGFLVLSFSDFVPLLHFGLLTALTMAAALVGDLVVLPASLAWPRRLRGGPSSARRSRPEAPPAPARDARGCGD